MKKNNKTNEENDNSKKSLFKNKKILIIFTIIIILIVLLISSYFIFFSKVPTKSTEETEKILNSNGYKNFFYFTLGKNYYDNKGNCYEFGYEKLTDCKRETNFTYNTITLDLYKKDEEIELSGDIKLNDDYTISEYSLQFEKTTEENTSNSEINTNYYRYHISDKYEYLTYMNFSLVSDNNDCAVYIKYDGEKKLKECSSSIQNELNNTKNKSMELLKKLKLNPIDLLSYIKWYGEKYSIPKFKEEKEKMDDQLPYATIKKFIKNAGYTISKDKKSIVVSEDKLSDNSIFMFTFDDNNELEFIGYKSNFLSYNDYYFYYYPKYLMFFGSDTDDTCLYSYVKGHKENAVVNEGYYCTDKQKNDIETLDYRYYDDIEKMEITEEEFISFAKQYYEENK